MKTKQTFLLALALLVSTVAFSQVGIGTTTPDASAILDIDATDKGFLPPRMTTAQRDNLLNPPEGLVIYNLTNIELEVAGDGEWINLSTNESTPFSVGGSTPSSEGSVGIGTTSPSDYAILDITSTDKGFLPPRMTTLERNDITSPAEGLVIYNTDRNCIQSFKGLGWRNHCTPIGTTDVYNPETGQVWMDRNLGASRVATSRTDADSFGDLYQWGRAADGHEKRNSTLHDGTSIRPNTIIESGIWDGKFITIPANVNRNDWVTTQTNNAWNTGTLAIPIKTTTDPCPSGYRVPTIAELNSERLSWSSNDAAGAFASPLKLPTSGSRTGTSGILGGIVSAFYWSSTSTGVTSRVISYNINNNSGNENGARRSSGYSVRCLKD